MVVEDDVERDLMSKTHSVDSARARQNSAIDAGSQVSFAVWGIESGAGVDLESWTVVLDV